MNLKYFNFILVIFCVLAFSACATVPRWNVPAVPSTPEREGPSEEYKAKAMEERIEPPAVNVVKFRPDDVIDEKIIKNFLKRACEVKFPEKANIATLPVFSRPQVRSVQDKTIIVLPETHYKEATIDGRLYWMLFNGRNLTSYTGEVIPASKDPAKVIEEAFKAAASSFNPEVIFMVVEVRKEWFMFHVFEPLAGPVFCPPPKKAKKKVEKKEVVSKKNKIKEPEKPCDSCKKMQDEAIRLLRKW